MQMSIYYQENDEYLIDLVEKLANRRRMSKSAMILSILEEYFEANKRVGQILKDMRAVEEEQLKRALKKQEKMEEKKKLGKILLERDYVREVDLDRALQVQNADS